MSVGVHLVLMSVAMHFQLDMLVLIFSFLLECTAF